jgi:hypothetical protein
MKTKRLVLHRETLRRLDEAQLARVNGVGTAAACDPWWTTITTVYAPHSDGPGYTCPQGECDIDTTGDGGGHTVGGHYIP